MAVGDVSSISARTKRRPLIKDIVAAIQPVITDGHLAQARSVGSGEYWLSLNNFVNLTMNVKLAGGPIDYFPLDPVALTFGAVGISAKAPHPNTALLAANFLLSKECETFLAKFGRIPTRADVESNPPGIVAAINKKKVITVLADGRRRAQMAAAVQRIVQGALSRAGLHSRFYWQPQSKRFEASFKLQETLPDLRQN